MYVSIAPSQNRLLLLWTPPKAPASMTAERDPDSFDDLILAVAERADRAAFSSLFSHFGPRVKAFMQRGGIGATQAEDMMQEVFLTVWRKAGLFDPARAAAGAWIFAIARNHKIDTLRRDRRPVPGEDPSDEVAVPAADMLIATEQSGRALRGAIETLPEDQLEIVRLAFYEDLSHGEIEQRLGVPLGTVKSRLRLAMTKLRRVLKDEL